MNLYFQYSSEIDVPFRIRIHCLDGILSSKQLRDPTESSIDYTVLRPEQHEIFLSFQLHALGKPIGPPIISSLHSAFDQFDPWNEWVLFPVKYRDLPRDAKIYISLWNGSSLSGNSMRDPSNFPLNHMGTASLSVFDENGRSAFGRQRIMFHPTTKNLNSAKGECIFQNPIASLIQIEERINDYSEKVLPRVEWMDRLVIKRIEKQSETYTTELNSLGKIFGLAASMEMYLSVDFLKSCFPIIHQEFPVNENDNGEKLLHPSQTLIPFDDPEAEFKNPIQEKCYRSFRGLDIDYKQVKPSVDERNRLRVIIQSPSRQLKSQEKELLRKFRYALLEDSRALGKFLRCVHWDNPEDVNQAIQIMYEWKQSEISDALELLSSNFSHPLVRKFAVQQLEKASNEELELFLLQLVQAIKFETEVPSPLSKFLIRRCSVHLRLANFFHWYVKVEIEDPKHSHTYKAVFHEFLSQLSDSSAELNFVQCLVKEQETFIEELVDLSNRIKSSRKRADKLKEELTSLLQSEKKYLSLPESPCLCPLEPTFSLGGIDPSKCSVFKSAKLPLRLVFNSFDTKSQGSYSLMFKTGDDLRQDQLIIQMIHLMDQILKKVLVDVRLTPYRVLATSTQAGCIELVDSSHNISSILEEFGGGGSASAKNPIGQFLDKHNPKASSRSIALDNFVKSSAGYSVITYILGIGDRHLDNILVRTSGHLFHIDFGFIFGRDPKPFPAKIRVIKEMIECMGGYDSKQYENFLNLCCSVFRILRKNASLILNLLKLMSDSGIDDLNGDVERTLSKVQDKFRLELDDDEADQFMVNTINESVAAFFPAFFEKIHSFKVRYAT